MKLHGKAKAAFLRKMARGRNKKHGGSKKRKKRTTEGHHVATKKRRHHHKGKKSTRRRSHAGGSLSKWLPPTDKLIGIGTAFAYGKVEAAASKDTQHVLNKVPALVPQIGRTGNVGAILWLGGVITRHPIVKSVAAGVLHVAAYQNGRQGTAFSKDAPEFKMSGPGRAHMRDEMLVEQYLNRRG